jgi:hypothetical protein
VICVGSSFLKLQSSTHCGGRILVVRPTASVELFCTWFTSKVCRTHPGSNVRLKYCPVNTTHNHEAQMNNHTQSDKHSTSHLHNISVSNQPNRAPSRLHACIHAVVVEFGSEWMAAVETSWWPRSYLCFTLSWVFNKNLFRINLLKKYMFVFYIFGG